MHRRHNILALDRFHFQLDKTVRQKQRVSGLYLRIETFVIDRNVRRVTGRVVRRQHEPAALLQLDFALRKLAEPHFRSFRIQEQRNDRAFFRRRFPYRIDARRLLLMRAVGKIEPRAIHAARDQRVQHAVALCRRSHRADDFRLFPHSVFASPRKNFQKSFPIVQHLFRSEKRRREKVKKRRERPAFFSPAYCLSAPILL